MPVWIESIHAHNLGPIPSLNIELGRFNLIFGKNEKGKTFLTEFLLRSLFKSAKGWNLRSSAASGKVIVAGLGEGRMEFTPSGRKKLEDYLQESREGLPANLAKLLIVRGADLNLAEDNPSGADRSVLKEFLSGEAVIDEIGARISRTLQEAAISGGEILGAARGEIKQRAEIWQALSGLDNLFREVDALFSGGKRAYLKRRLEQVASEIDGQEKAKRFRAYSLQGEAARLEEEQGGLTRAAVTELRSSDRTLRATAEQLERDRRRLEKLGKAADQYVWLRQAIGEVEKRSEGVIPAEPLWAPIGTVLLLVCGVGALIGWPRVAAAIGLGVGAILAAMGLAAWYTKKLRQRLRKSHDSFQTDAIGREYEARFGSPQPSLATMKSKFQELEDGYTQSRGLQEAIQSSEAQMLQEKHALKEELHHLGWSTDEEGNWEKVIDTTEDRLTSLEREQQGVREELARLDIDPSDYLNEDPGIAYQKSVLQKLETEWQELDQELASETSLLDNLKHQLCGKTGNELSVEWEGLIEDLRSLRERKSEEYRQLTAEMLAKILVYQEIEGLRLLEDAKIGEALASQVMSQPLQHITQQYDRVVLEDDRLIISGPYGDYPLGDLSTGAREQVLLSLRLGCAARLMGQESLFLILDDAFQHADWNRRRRLVDEVARLAEAKWQVLYLSMDDHIRDLFVERGSRIFGEEFRLINLEEGGTQK
jgi:hypothetical protein